MIHVPPVIQQTDEYLSLDLDGKASFERRISGVRSVCASLSDGTRLNGSASFKDFVENLELDVSVLQEFDVCPFGTLSRWLVHYSWTFETSPKAMHSVLSPSERALLDTSEPRAESHQKEFEAWFENIGGEIVKLIDAFMKAMTFDRAMALLVLIDILFARILLACFKLRLNF